LDSTKLETKEEILAELARDPIEWLLKHEKYKKEMRENHEKLFRALEEMNSPENVKKWKEYCDRWKS
jgi:hypothetical protein